MSVKQGRRSSDLGTRSRDKLSYITDGKPDSATPSWRSSFQVTSTFCWPQGSQDIVTSDDTTPIARCLQCRRHGCLSGVAVASDLLTSWPGYMTDRKNSEVIKMTTQPRHTQAAPSSQQQQPDPTVRLK